MSSFTVANHNSRTNPKDYINYPDLEFEDIPDMVTHGTNYCACKLKENYRLDENFDGNVDVLIIDIDEKCSIEQAKVLFKKYEFYLITTRSHQKDKGGVTCDRFRLFFKLDKTIHIRQHMEEIYSRFILDSPFIDTSCRNVSRFFYPSPSDAIVFHNEGRRYPTALSEMDEETIKDPLPHHLSNQEFKTVKWAGRMLRVLQNVEYEMYEGDTDEENKLKGVQVFLDNEFVQGNKSNSLFQAGSMMKSDGFSEDETINFLIKEWETRSSGRDKFKDALFNIRGAFKY